MLVAIELNKGAIFKDVGHALHTAFVVIANEARQGCVTRAALLRIMEYAPKLSDTQADWFEALRGAPAGTIDFSGLRDDDIRAQCALIVSAVRSKLPEAEMNVVLARFGATDYEDVDGSRRYAFSRERSDAILALADWMRPLVRNVPAQAVDLLLARLFADHAKTKITVRELADSFKGSHMKFHRAGKVVREHVKQLEVMAHARLHPYFVEQGIVPPRRQLSTTKEND
ncbi:hypothetical protein [Herbaspirillum frisingense]|uniref:hypothetical protein n=1 Tax=Herbaspirillum frisingense TaxID=92645 RepID=UPI0039B09C76